MFPNPNDSPPLLSESPVHLKIAGLVSRHLRIPERATRARSLEVMRASMPEAAVYKYGKPLSRKNKIWFPFKIPMPAPTMDALLTKQFEYPKLRGPIAAILNRGHANRALFLGQKVHHIRS